jgi:AcrR family transcriptional regulator
MSARDKQIATERAERDRRGSACSRSGVATLKPRRQDAARNRQLLLDAARNVFATEGLESDVQTVARTAGVGTGTLYRHFPSKDDLITALVDDLSDEVMATAAAMLERRDGTGLWDFLWATGEIQARNQGLLCRLWVGAARTEYVAAIRRKITELVTDARAHGTLPDSVGQPDVILVLHGLRGVIEANFLDRPDAWRRYLALAVRGLKAPPQPPA